MHPCQHRMALRLLHSCVQQMATATTRAQQRAHQSHQDAERLQALNNTLYVQLAQEKVRSGAPEAPSAYSQPQEAPVQTCQECPAEIPDLARN